MVEQIDLFAAHTRSTDPETSHYAAAAVNGPLNVKISIACNAVYAAMQLLGPANDETLQFFYDDARITHGWPPQRCVRKRRKDLVDAGKARWTGTKDRNCVGLLVRVWEAL